MPTAGTPPRRRKGNSPGRRYPAARRRIDWPAAKSRLPPHGRKSRRPAGRWLSTGKPRVPLRKDDLGVVFRPIEPAVHFRCRFPGYDYSEPYQIREYVPGDGLRQIHWKLSQKTDSLMVRELGLPVAEEVLLLLDTSITVRENAADALDAAMTALLSLSRSLTEQGITHSGFFENQIVTQPFDVS